MNNPFDELKKKIALIGEVIQDPKTPDYERFRASQGLGLIMKRLEKLKSDLKK